MATRRPGPGAAYLAAGVLATGAQVLLLRELIVDVAGDETAVGIGLAGWFVGIAGGAALARRGAPGKAGARAAAALSLTAVLPLVSVVVGRLLRYALAPSAGELPGLGLTLLLAAATLLPSGAAVGMAFTTLASSGAAGAAPGRVVVRLYVLESVGSLAGGVAVTVLVLAGVAPLLLAGLLGLAGALLALAAAPAGRGWLASASAGCAVAILAAAPLDRWSEAVRFAGTAGGIRLLATRDTPYQHLAVGGDDVRHLYSSGQYLTSFPDPYADESQGHLLALLAPNPRRVLLIGALGRGLVSVLLRHPVAQLVTVEPDAEAERFLETLLAPGNGSGWDRRHLRVTGDPRNYITDWYSGRWDLVLLLAPEPATLLQARLATVDFYRQVAARLTPEGVFVVSLPAAPTVLAGETEAIAGSLVRSLRQAFPVVRATLGPDALAIAGRSPSAVTFDASVLAARFRERGVRSPSFDAALLPVLFPPDRVAQQQAALDAAAARAPLSLDDRPVAFLHALARRQQIVAGSRGGLVRRAFRLPVPVLLGLAFVPSLLAWRRMASRDRPSGLALAASHAVALAGAAGLGWSLLVLFSFQTHAGELYGLLGALVAVFMLGLASGGALVPHALQAEVIDGSSLPGAARMLRLWLTTAVLFAVALPVTLEAAGRASASGLGTSLLCHGGLLLAAGLVTGGVFPLAVEVRLASGDAVAEAAGRIETADHLGAAVAGLTAAVLFVPLLGLTRTALLLAALLATAAAACAWGGRPSG